MKKLHTFNPWQRPQAGMFRELLAGEGISCLVRNEQIVGAMGEIPFLECYPELWVVDDDVLPRARMLLEKWLKEDPSAEPWTCPACGEVLEGQFGACWKCGQRIDG